MDTLERKRNLTRILVHLILILVSITMLTPFLWMILTAFKTTTEATSVNPFVILPSRWRTDAFSAVITYMDFGRLYWNTILMIFFRVLLLCLCEAPLSGEGNLLFARSLSDDGAIADFHHPAVSDGCEAP